MILRLGGAPKRATLETPTSTAREESLLVRYEGARAFVEIAHEPREWSVDVAVGPFAIFGARYSLADILAVRLRLLPRSLRFLWRLLRFLRGD